MPSDHLVRVLILSILCFPQSGWLEVMLERRTGSDDSRGLGQGVQDNRPTETTLLLTLERRISSKEDPLNFTSSPSPSLLSHRLGSLLNYPLSIFMGQLESSSELVHVKHGSLLDHASVVNGMKTSFSPLSSPFPCDFHLVNLKVQRLLRKVWAFFLYC